MARGDAAAPCGHVACCYRTTCRSAAVACVRPLRVDCAACRVTLVVLDVQENFNAFVRQMRVIRIFRSLKMIVRIQSLRVIVRRPRQANAS